MMKNLTRAALLLLAIQACDRLPSPKNGDAAMFHFSKCRSFFSVNLDSLSFHLEALKAAADRRDHVQMAMLENAKGVFALDLGEPKTCIELTGNALLVFEKNGKDDLAALAHLTLANAFKQTGEYDNAVESLLKTLKIAEKTGDSTVSNRAFSGLSQIYQLKNDPENARKYIDLGKKLNRSNPVFQLQFLHTEANMLGMTGQLDSALAVDDEGIALAQKHGLTGRLTSFWDNKALCFMESGRLDSAETYFFKCLELDKKNGQVNMLADTYCNLVELYQRKNEPQKVEKTARLALQTCDSIGYTRGKRTVYLGLASFYEKAGDLKKTVAAKDSAYFFGQKMIDEASEEKIATLNVLHETEKKEQTIARQSADLTNGRYLLGLLAAVSAMLGLGAFFIWRTQKIRRGHAVEQAISTQKTVNAQAIFETEQNERIRIARDLHDSIGQKLAVLKMQISRENAAPQSVSLLDESIHEVRAISHNLLPEALNFGLFAAIRGAVEKMGASSGIQIGLKMSDDCADLSLPIAQSLHVFRIFQEVVGNAIRHSRAKNIDIEISRAAGFLNLKISDDGIGIDPKSIENSAGIGWKNIFARLDLMKGKIDIAPNLGKGSAIRFAVPIYSRRGAEGAEFF